MQNNTPVSTTLQIIDIVISKYCIVKLSRFLIFACFEWPSVLLSECFGLSIRC